MNTFSKIRYSALLVLLCLCASEFKGSENPGIQKLIQLTAVGRFKQSRSISRFAIEADSEIKIAPFSLSNNLFVACYRSGNKLIIAHETIQNILKNFIGLACTSLELNIVPSKVFSYDEKTIIIEGIGKSPNETSIPVVLIYDRETRSASYKYASLHDIIYRQMAPTIVVRTASGLFRAVRTEEGIILQEPNDYYDSPLADSSAVEVLESSTEYLAYCTFRDGTRLMAEKGIFRKGVATDDGVKDWLRTLITEQKIAEPKILNRAILLLAHCPEMADFPTNKIIFEALEAERPVHLTGPRYISDRSYRASVRKAHADGLAPLNPFTRQVISDTPQEVIQDLHAHLISTHGESYSLEDLPDADMISGKSFILDVKEVDDIVWHLLKKVLDDAERKSLEERHGYSTEKLKTYIQGQLQPKQKESEPQKVEKTFSENLFYLLSRFK